MASTPRRWKGSMRRESNASSASPTKPRSSRSSPSAGWRSPTNLIPAASRSIASSSASVTEKRGKETLKAPVSNSRFRAAALKLADGETLTTQFDRGVCQTMQKEDQQQSERRVEGVVDHIAVESD